MYAASGVVEGCAHERPPALISQTSTWGPVPPPPSVASVATTRIVAPPAHGAPASQPVKFRRYQLLRRSLTVSLKAVRSRAKTSAGSGAAGAALCVLHGSAVGS